MTNDFAPVADIMLSTEKLRMRLLHEGLNETVVNECESIMMTELLELHSQIKSQEQQHSVLVDRLRQLEVTFYFQFCLLDNVLYFLLCLYHTYIMHFWESW